MEVDPSSQSSGEIQEGVDLGIHDAGVGADVEEDIGEGEAVNGMEIDTDDANQNVNDEGSCPSTGEVKLHEEILNYVMEAETQITQSSTMTPMIVQECEGEESENLPAMAIATSNTAQEEEHRDDIDDGSNLGVEEELEENPILRDVQQTSAFCISASKEIRKLDTPTSSAIRKGQIITKISDVVRELVDNSIDAYAKSVQVHIDKFGTEKIEVRDTGKGISPTDFQKAVTGGYSSKLGESGHLSSHSHYGFRGEALSSICLVGKVSIATKTRKDQRATKYVLNNSGGIESQSNTSMGPGTIVTVENLFFNFPVRRKWIQMKGKCSDELKEIENYLKAVGIANPEVHISLRHDSQVIWTKPIVTTIHKSLFTVLGHSIARNLERCGPVGIEVEGDEHNTRNRAMEAFFLKKPIDMRTMSYTNNKMTMVFVNKKRVVVREFEKLLQLYTVAAIERPAPADRRRFPVAVIVIKIPFDEVDFNRDIDKSKVFLEHKDSISKKLESVLQNFYGIGIRPELDDIRGTASGASRTTLSQSPPKMEMPVSQDSNAIHDKNGETRNRKVTVMQFLEELPTKSSANFSQSPIKNQANQMTPVRPDYSPEKRQINISTTPELCKSNFDVNIDDLFDMDTPPQENQGDLDKDVMLLYEKNEAKTSAEGGKAVDIVKWAQGRITDSNGNLMQNVKIITSATANANRTETPPGPNFSSNALDKVRSGLPSFQASQSYSLGREHKRQKLGQGGSSLSVSLSSTPRQVTLDRYKNWDLSKPMSNSQSQFFPSHPSPTGVRLPFTQPRTVGGTMLTPSGCRESIRSSQADVSQHKGRTADRINYAGRQVLNEKNGSASSSVTPHSRYGINSNCVIAATTTYNPENTVKGDITQGLLIGPIEEGKLYMAKINGILGSFSPLNLIQAYPSLKFDLKVFFHTFPAENEPSKTKVVVRKECVPKLFQAYLKIIDASKTYVFETEKIKIFHPLLSKLSINDLQVNISDASPREGYKFSPD